MESFPSITAPSSSSSSVHNSSNETINTTEVTWRGMNIPLRLGSSLSMVLDYSGIMSSTNEDSSTSHLQFRPRHQLHSDSSSSSGSDASGSACNGTGELAIRIIGSGDQEIHGSTSPSSFPSSPIHMSELGHLNCDGMITVNRPGVPPLNLHDPEIRRQIMNEQILNEGNVRVVPMSEVFGMIGRGGSRDSSSSSPTTTAENPNYDIQLAGKWLEQLLPLSLLLLVVFIRQHFQGFFVMICISAVLFKSDEIVTRQTALKGDRNVFVLFGLCFVSLLQVIGIYWWYQNDDLLYPLAMLPPKETPPFLHAIFIILVNDTLVRQAAMAFKCLVLIYYKNGRGHSYRRQGQILTLVEYTLLLYRALLPAPVWSRFFLNKDYGSLFSSLTTGLYLTFKLTTILEKVHYFITATKAVSKREVHYGVYATKEQVDAAGDMCSICQEKMRAPILLRCKHMFCEDCVSEWFERERTCPLCRALVKSTDLRTFGDGSTDIYFQLF